MQAWYPLLPKHRLGFAYVVVVLVDLNVFNCKKKQNTTTFLYRKS